MASEDLSLNLEDGFSIDVADAPGEVHSTPTVVAPPPLPPEVLGMDDEALQKALGEFRLVRQIGVGAMGAVYLAEHRVIGSRIAIKFLKPGLAGNPQLVTQFHDEARAVNRVGHPGIVRIYDLRFVPPAGYLLLMEYLDGRPLSKLTRSPVQPRVAIPILAQICDALEAAHRVGVVHRDVKPDNIFLVPRDRREVVRLLDFGAAHLNSTLAQTEEGTQRLVLGTPAYMPPEQWRCENIDGRTDVYAVGVVAYLLATGKLPFESRGRSPKELYLAHRDEIPVAPHLVESKVPVSWSQVIMKAMAKRPEDRFDSAAELSAALRAVISRKPRASRSVPRLRRSNAGDEVSLTPSYLPTFLPDPEPAAQAAAGVAMTIEGAVWSASFRAYASTTASTSPLISAVLNATEAA